MNLLFFAQLVNELLFDYSNPSNRISTLNSHYLCKDALHTIRGIEVKGLHEGNLKPIMEELYSEIKKDPAFSDALDPCQYFIKFNEGKYHIVNRISDLNYNDQKCIAHSLSKVFFKKNEYYSILIKKIRDIIIDNNPEKQQELFRLTKSTLTELVNIGYSTKYIYYTMNSVFWNERNHIQSPEIIDSFFHAFDFCEKEYTVLIKVKKKKIEQVLPYFGQYIVDDAEEIYCTTRDGKVFKRKYDDECFIQMKIKRLDPFVAIDKVRYIFDSFTAAYRLQNHFYRYKISMEPCGVYDEHGMFYKSENDIKAVEHKKTPSDKYIQKSMLVFAEMVIEKQNRSALDTIMNAIRFHAHSLDSNNEENQLLDLWAVFETVLDISNKHISDRIQQICMILVPLLKKNYIYSLFDQLADDIKNYNKDIYKKIVSEKNDRRIIVQQICEFTLLKDKEEDRKEVLAQMQDYPLLKERIEYYYDKLSTPNKVNSFVEKHAERVRWQVMRIYRNRNMIIHNGTSMSYLGLLIENLHSYVDDFLTYTINSLAEGNSIQSMSQGIYVSECQWIDKFCKRKEANEPITSEQISYMLIS